MRVDIDVDPTTGGGGGGFGTGGVAADTHAAASKTTPVDADEIPLVDSAASWVLKKLTWANLKATLLTYFTAGFRKKPRADSSASGDITPDPASYDIHIRTAQAASLAFINPATTPVNGEMFVARIKDNGTTRAVSRGTNYAAVDGVTMITATTVGKYHEELYRWNTTLGKYLCFSSATY